MGIGTSSLAEMNADHGRKFPQWHDPVCWGLQPIKRSSRRHQQSSCHLNSQCRWCAALPGLDESTATASRNGRQLRVAVTGIRRRSGSERGLRCIAGHCDHHVGVATAACLIHVSHTSPTAPAAARLRSLYTGPLFA